MKKTLTLLLVLALPFLFGSCSEQESDAGSGKKEEAADTHQVIIEEYLTLGRTLSDQMGSIRDKSSAEAFVALTEELKPKLQEVLDRAKALPSPTAEEKATFKGLHEEVDRTITEKRNAMQASLAQKPPSQEDMLAIAHVMQNMEDGDLLEISDEIDKIYGFTE